jgi:hypothetical protein
MVYREIKVIGNMKGYCVKGTRMELVKAILKPCNSLASLLESRLAFFSSVMTSGSRDKGNKI